MIPFAHLHVHSDFSLLDGASSVKALVKAAKERGMEHLAITDHGNMFGVLRFYEECLEQGINPVLGNEFYMAPVSRFDKSGNETGNKYYHLVLLAETRQGYMNLMKLTSLAYTEGFYYKPRIDRELLEQYHEGLICLSACIAGEIPVAILNGQLELAEQRARELARLFGPDHFYLELQDHGIPEQKTANKALLELSLKTGIPLVATNDIHYANRDDAVAQDILLCIGTGHKRNDEKRMRFHGDQFYLKTPEEMAALFPGHEEALLNTVRIAERCRYDYPYSGPKLPVFDIPEGYADEEAYIRGLTCDGLAARYGTITEEIRTRADYELGIIIKMGFIGYFLIVADFINWAKEHDIPVGPGRGSGAGSIVAYAMRITDIDPLRYKLLFERFLNPERISMPDFDVDFCFERRGEVIEYVTQKYGTDRVGQIITFGTLKAKAVIKDVARALDIPYEEANQIAKLVPEDPKMTLEKAFEQESRLRELAEDPRYTELFEIGRKLENKNRHSSLHAAGIVIGQTELTDYVPLYRDPKTGGVATQFTMDLIEECGLVKMDFLGLKTLTLLKNAQNLVRKRGGDLADFDIEKVSEEDEATYAMLGEGKSGGIFQFESQGMQSILKRAKPTRMEDLIALNALYRPGPMAYIPQFIESKFDASKIVYPAPSLKDILEETYGVIVYQEQVMQVAQIIAGYSLGQADLLRRAMGKKKAEVLAKEKIPFIEGAVKNGYSAQDADRIFEILVPFAGYGFNKSHAAAYSVVAYRTAYLKANYPAEFMAANLTNEITSTDKLPQYIDEARKMGLEIVPPSINHSDRYFSVVDGKIVYGLLGIKGLGDGAAREIVAKREEGGPYLDLMDFLERVELRSVGKKVIEILIQTGAFDLFGHNRPTLLANLERAWDYAQSKKDDKKFGQSSLFEDSGEQEYPDFVFETMPDMDAAEVLRIEKELMGFFISGHPMDAYRTVWERSSTLDLAHQERAAPDREYTVMGILKAVRPYQTKNGKWMGFGTLEDFNGELDLVFFSDTWEKMRDSLIVDEVVAFRGKVDTKRERPSFLVDGREDPAELTQRSFKEVHIRLDPDTASDEESLDPLRDFLFEQSGACQVYLHLGNGERETVIKAANAVSCPAEDWVLEAIGQHEGILEVWKE